MQIELLALSSKSLRGWHIQPLPFGAWLHCDREIGPQDIEAITGIIESGCRLIMATGKHGESVHEIADWNAIEHTNELVLTFSESAINQESAFAFLSTQCPLADCEFRMISAFSESVELELEQMTKMAAVLQRARLELG